MAIQMTADVKPKLAIFMPELFGAGGQRSMLNLAHGIAAAGYPLDLVLAKAKGEFLSEVREPVRIVDLNASRALASAPALVRYLRRERPEAMLSVFGFLNVVALPAWRLSRVKTRLFVNEQNTVSMEAGNASSWGTRVTPLLMRHLYRWANGVVVVSQGVRDDLVQLTDIPRQRITVIYNPSVVGAELQEKAKESLDHPWFKQDQPPVLVAVGRLQQQKDYPMLLQAFAQVRRSQPVRLLILGEGKERPMLEALVKELNLEEDVGLPGFVMNPYAYMAQASLFVLSSRWEGLPTVLIEALCCGTPAVSTDCPSGPREILRNGKYGKLTPVGDAAAFAQAIKAALDEPLPKPPPESWQPYDLGVIVHHYLDLLLGRLPADRCNSIPGDADV
jgi:glycosyltransferase involved in cell wall biosynthesis